MSYESLPEGDAFLDLKRRIDYVEKEVAKTGDPVAGQTLTGDIDIVRLKFGSFDNLILNPDFDVNDTFLDDTVGLQDPNLN